MRVFSRIKRENGIENINLEEINAEITASRILHFDDTYCRKESFFMSLTEIFDNIVEGDSVSNNIMGITIDGLENNHASTPSEVLTNCYINGNDDVWSCSLW